MRNLRIARYFPTTIVCMFLAPDSDCFSNPCRGPEGFETAIDDNSERLLLSSYGNRSKHTTHTAVSPKL